MTKIIVTHTDPDLDAIGAVWLLKKFDLRFRDAEVVFLDKSTSEDVIYDGVRPGESDDVIFVDIGFSRFDHHQTDAYICSATLVRDDLSKRNVLPKDPVKISALEKILDYILKFDHGKLRTLENEYREFLPVAVIDGKSIQSQGDSVEIVDFGTDLFEALYSFLVEKENFLKDWGKRVEFKTQWGKGVGIETAYYTFSRDFGLPDPYAIVVTVNPSSGYRRFWGFKKEVDFSSLYEDLKRCESDVGWYLHPSKKILLSGAKSSPNEPLSRLSLEELIEKVRI